MKMFQKKITAVLLLAAMVFCMLGEVTPTSAATLTAKQYLSKMQKVTTKAKSYEFTQTTTIKQSIMGQTTETKSTTKQTMFQNPLKIKIVTTETLDNAGTKSETKTVTYMTEDKKGKINEYISVDGADYQKIDVSNLSSVSSEGLEAKTFSNAKIVKKSVKVNKVDTVLISAEIKGSYLTDEIEKMGLGDFGIDTSTLKPMKVSIWIDKKTYRPVKMVNDYKDFYSSLLGGYFDVSVAKSTTTYKNFNKAKAFSLPKSCK